MTFALFIVLDYLTEFGNSFVEWVKVSLVIHRRFVHVVEDLLHDMPQILTSASYYQGTRHEGTERNPCGGGPTHPHRCDLGISRWTFPGLSDGHEEERKQVEHIRHCCVQPVVVLLLVISDFVQSCDCAIPIRG